jgi:hypothetical protein
VAVDDSGNVYVADSLNNTIRKITPLGVVTTFAGLAGSRGSVDGAAGAARFNNPTGIAVDSLGNVYVADTSNSTIRKISPNGIVTTLAGTAGSFASADGTGVTARFSSPKGVAVDGAGNVYVSDTSNYTIRKITPDGIVTTFAGMAGNNGSTNGLGSAARFYFPDSVAVDGAGNVYVSDGGNATIRKITAVGQVTTLAGLAGSVGWTDGTGSAARFGGSSGLAVDDADNVYVTDTNNYVIRKITSAGVVTTVAGARGTRGATDGNSGIALFNAPSGVTIDGAGNLYVADAGNDTIRKITPANIVSTLAGKAGPGSTDGAGSAAKFSLPIGLALDGAGDIYVADTNNNTIRKITPSGAVTTLAGAADAPVSSIDGTGSAARFNAPQGAAVDTSGNVYIADTGNNTIRKISPVGVVTTFAGSPLLQGSVDGAGSAARFNSPIGIAVDTLNNVYIADSGNHEIRKITPAGVVSTLAGNAQSTGSTDGMGNVARFDSPSGVAVDTAGNVYVTDSLYNTVRKITPGGLVTTIAGAPSGFGSADGMGAAARFVLPYGLAVDRAGVVYLADSGNNTIRMISPAGSVTTLAGSSDASGSVSATGSAARFNGPIGIAVDAAGTLYVADSYNNVIRKGIPAAKSKVLGDFDGDGKADLIWTNTQTGERSMWLMNGSGMKAGATLGVVPVEWVVSATGDFDGDGKADIFWTNTVTGDRAIWLMNGSVTRTNTFMGTVPVDWVISGTGDFDGNGKKDLVWTNTTTGDRAMWLMNGSTVSGGGYLGTIPVEWSISGVGDFDGDGKADLIWSNMVTGERSMWFQNGSATVGGTTLNTIPVAWVISAVGDFNGDGKADVFLTNTVNGDRALWLMNGSSIATNAFMGTVPVDWSINGTGDFNGDAKKDLVWSNTSSGDRAMWLLSGSTVTGGGYLGTVPVEWKINN